MSGFKFMGEQEDPEFDTIEARGDVRIYDGTEQVIHATATYAVHPCGAEQTPGSSPGPTGFSDATGKWVSERPVTCRACLEAIAKHVAACEAAR